MIQQLNLSSRPFRNRTLPWILTAMLLAVSVFGAIFVFSEWQKVSRENETVKKDIAKIDPNIAAIKGESEKIRESLAPEQERALSESWRLISRKRFSWSRLFADLENVLPRTVSVSRVSVRDIYQDKDRTLAELEFAVLSRDYQSVTNMIDQMNASGTFNAELRGQDLQRDKGNLTEYTMQLRYSPGFGQPVAANNSANNLTAEARDNR